MATTLSTNISSVLDPALLEVFFDGAIRVADVDYFTWMRVRPSSDKTIQKSGINPPGAYASHVEGNDFTFSAMVEGSQKTYTMSEVALAYQVSSFSLGFLDRTTLMEHMRQMGAAAARKLNADAYAVLSGGFSDTGPDGVSLFDNSHPAETGGVQDNLGTAALSEANLQAVLESLRRLKTPDNILAGCTPTHLIVPPELEWTAKELVGSTYSGADLQLNILSTKGLQVVVTPEFSDATDYFVIDANTWPAYQYVNKGSSPKQWIDPDSDSYRVSDRLVYTQGYDTWRGTFGQQVAG